MEPSKELNKEFKDEVNLIFADLFKEIGSNRAQLANKVLGIQKEINKELTKDKIDDQRKKEIRIEVSRTVKMAAQQLPHLKRNLLDRPTPPPVKAVEKPLAEPAAKKPAKPLKKPVEKPAQARPAKKKK